MKKINNSGSITGTAFLAIAVLLISSFTSCGGPGSRGESGTERIKLANGMEVLLRENHASPMITSLVFVSAGSKYESEYNNGVTHFLEHLLFNGTATQSEEELSDGVERLGGYINAFTRKEFTAFLVLMPKGFFDYGLATQADMLFNSVFPEEKLAKERGIVIEEIKMGNDQEGAAAESFFEEKAMAGTGYSRPVIGYESTIANIPREAVIDYYKRFYEPNNMTALIIGDFETDQMKKTVESIFGRFKKGKSPAPENVAYVPLEGKKVYRTPARTKSAYINYSIEAPHYTDSNYYAFALISDYLGDQENSPLVAALKSGAEPLVSSVSVYLDTKQEFTRLNIDIVTERWDMADSIIVAADNVIENLAQDPPSEELLNGYKVTRRCEEIYYSEKLHYYGFVKAPLLAVTNWDFFSGFQKHIDSTMAVDVKRAAADYLAPCAYITTVTYPHRTADPEIFQPARPSDEDVKGFFAGQKYPEYDLVADPDFRLPEVGEVEYDDSRYASFAREILPNGLTLVVKSNPDSRVFALNVIGKNRSATEPEGKAGITDFVNRMIERGTENYSAEELGKRLSAIGANVTLYDNPWIPYDDRYTTSQYSFMKFETIDQFTQEGIDLFTEMIARPAFDSVDVENVRQEMFGLIGRSGASPYKVARQAFYNTLFKGTAYARPIIGNFRTISSITPDDLREYHRKIYAPENMIITVGTNLEPVKVMTWLKEKLGEIPATGFKPVAAEKPAGPDGVVEAHESMQKEQVYIYIGNLMPSCHSSDAAAIRVAAAVLSERLQNRLREKESLAYSVGAGTTLDKDFGWYYCSMGTGAANFERAYRGIIEEIDRLKTEPPDENELQKAVNGIWGSYLTANLSRINQAYYMGVYEYLGLGYNYGKIYMDNIHEVTPERVMEVAGKYFDTDNYVIATAGEI